VAAIVGPRTEPPGAKAALLRLREDVLKYTGPFDLPEPDDETHGTYRKSDGVRAADVPTP